MFAFFMLSQLQKGQENWQRKAATLPAGWPRQGRIYVALCECVCEGGREVGRQTSLQQKRHKDLALVTFFGAAAAAAADDDDDDADGDES